MLTRKTYNALAQLISDNLIEFNSDQGIIILKDSFKYQLLEYLKRDNRNFDKDRFIDASQLENKLEANEKSFIERQIDNAIYSDPSDPTHISNYIDEALEHCTGSEIGKYGNRLS
jgi:hypothetical protein